jgi:hypothetical protein
MQPDVHSPAANPLPPAQRKAQLESELEGLKRLPRTAEVQKQAVEIMQELRSL